MKRKINAIVLVVLLIIYPICNGIYAAEANTSIGVIETRLTELNNNIDVINEDLNNLTSELEKINSNCTEEDLKSNKKLKSNVKSLNSAIQSLDKQIKNLKSKINTVRKKMTNVDELLVKEEPKDEEVKEEPKDEEVKEEPKDEEVKEEPKDPENTYDMAARYDKTKTDKENLQMAIDSGCKYIYLNRDLALPEGDVDSEYVWINRPVYVYGNSKNKIDVAIRITADNVTLDNLYLTREVRANRSFNDLTIKNCTIDGSDGMGLHFLIYEEGRVCKNITVENCTFKNNAWHGIAFKGFIPSQNKPANGGNGVGYGTYENVVIRNCKAFNNGYVVKSDGTIKSNHEYSAGINVVDSCYAMKNCVVENCVSYGNYSNGFHMESVPVKENVKLINCTAYENGKNAEGTHFGSGFSVIDEGVVLENCVSKNNTVTNYTSLKNQSHSPYKVRTANMINCYDNDILVNWNDDVANNVYNGENLIYNGDLKYGSMHYGFYYSSYVCWFYNSPNFLRRNGYKTKYYQADVYTDNNKDNFIHGKFMTNIFKLDADKKYKLTVVVDNSKNVNKDTFNVGLQKFNYVSDKNSKDNKIDKTFGDNGIATLVNNKDNNADLTTYTVELDAGTPSGYYTLCFKNSDIDNKLPLNNIDKDNLNIKIYNIKLEEIK